MDKLPWEELLRQANHTDTRKRPTHHEDNLQIQCVKWFGIQYPKYAPLLHHSPNGGARSKVEGHIFKQMGVRAGFPDLIFCHPNKHYHALFIEMKTHERGSRQSDSQKEWQQRLTSEGYQYTVCKDIDQFINIIKDYINDKQ